MPFKILFWGLVITLFSLAELKAQSKLSPVHTGVYHSGITGQVGVGTDTEKRYFGEIRFSASDVLDYPFGIEVYLHRNLIRDEWYNFHVGLLLGYYFDDNARLGLPVGFTIKPIENHRNFALLIEATPNVFLGNEFFNLRANLGIRYTFRKN